MKGLLRNTVKHRALLAMALPGIVLIFMFSYVPMYGALVAFKKFDYMKGIWGSPWIGFDNFKFLFTNGKTFARIVRNTLGYYFLFTAIGTVCNVALAIMLHECMFRHFVRITHTVMIMPTFISYVAVTYIVQAMLENNGVVNGLLLSLGQKKIQWYMSAKYWPTILTIVNIWKGTGYGCILYLSALSGMDPEIFEAAELDGANKRQQIRYLTLPMLASMISILLLLGLGGESGRDMVMTVGPNPNCAHLNQTMLDCYNRALERFPVLAAQLEQAMETGQPLGEDFAPIFG